MHPTEKKQRAVLHLRKILEDGYELQEKRNAYNTPPIPRNDDPAYKSQRESFNEAVRQNWGQNEYENWAFDLSEAFKAEKLNFRRFRHRTEASNEPRKNISNAAYLKKMLDELDLIVNDTKYFDTYTLVPKHPAVIFDEGVLSQGYNEHPFRDDKYRQLLEMLWEGRRILDENDNVLKNERPTSKEKIYKELNIDHERFKDIVRGIHAEMKRKSIDLKVKFPKDAFILVVQDSV